MEIDNKRIFTAFKGNKNKNSIQYPDHYAIHVEFTEIPKANNKIKAVKKNQILWNTNR